MPTFLDSGNEWLNDTIAPKKRVFRNTIKTFAEDQFPNVGTTADNIASFDGLITRMSGLVTALNSIANILFVTFDTRQASTVGTQVPDFAFLAQKAREYKVAVDKLTSLNNFEPSQVKAIGDTLQEIQVQQDAVETAVSNNPSGVLRANLTPLLNPITPLLNITNQRLSQFIQAYAQVAPATGNLVLNPRNPIRDATGLGYVGGYSAQDAFQALGDFGRANTGNVYAFKVADDLRKYRTGGAIVPDFSQTRTGSIFGSDGYVLNKVAYSDPRRFY